jgi:drug/metabolite transporter (DMT)-like permease
MGMLVTLPSFLMSPYVPVTMMDWGMVLGIVFVSVAGQLSMNQGFFYCRGWEGGVLMSSEVVFTSFMGIAFLGDPVSWRFWTGGVLIFGSAVALNRFKVKSSR